MVTGRDIARLAKVSQSSVSRALRGDPQISEATRERIRQLAEEHGYVPSEAGRSLATGTTGRVGIVVGNISSPYYAELIALLHRELGKAGYAALIIVVEMQGAAVEDVNSMRSVIGRSVDGVIMLTNHNIPQVAGRRPEGPFPTVWVNSDSLTAEGDWCMLDNDATGRLIAQEFIELGHKNIGMIFPWQSSPTERQREKAFRSELRRAGIALPRSQVYRGEADYQSGYDGLLALLARESPPSAIFCFSDIIAIGALSAARAAGVEVPGDVSIIGVGNVPMDGWELIQLSSIGYDLDSIVHWAVALLTERIQSDALQPLPHRRMLFEPKLMRRASHGPAKS